MRQFIPAIENQQPLDANSVFLGGTINGSTWRETVKQLLTVSYFDPVVKDWTPEDKEREEQAKRACGVLLYVISPKLKGFYTIAEVMVSILTETEKQIFVLVLQEDGGEKFDDHQMASLAAMKDLALTHRPSVQWSEDLHDTARALNKFD